MNSRVLQSQMDMIRSSWIGTLSGEEVQMHNMRWSHSRTSERPLREIAPPH